MFCYLLIYVQAFFNVTSSLLPITLALQFNKIYDERLIFIFLFAVDTRDLEMRKQELENWEQCCLNDLCKPYIRSCADEECQPVITAFMLSDGINNLLKALEQYSRSTVFIQMWDSIGEQACRSKAGHLSVDDVASSVWIPVKKEWENFCERVRTGTVVFKEMKKYFGFFKDNDDLLRSELFFMLSDDDTSWIDERVKQLQQYSLVESCTQGATVIMEVVDAYSLKGDFTAVKKISSVVSIISSCMIILYYHTSQPGDSVESCQIHDYIIS